MAERELFSLLLRGMFVAAAATFAALLLLPAPYGRHARAGFGPRLDARPAWVVMECPSVFAFLYFYARGPRSWDLVPLVFLALWQVQYLHRSFLYPLGLRGGRSRMPVLVVLLGVAFNLVNSYLNASNLTLLGRVYSESWLWRPAFWAGGALFAAGFAINRSADRALRRLGDQAGGYGVPRGGLYEWVSCPNYLGEVLQWAGWALATWSAAGLAFAVFTAANLVPRALSHHRWYRKRFPDYPPERRALIPLLL